MYLRHIALAVLIVLIWGFNFVVIKVGLEEFPPVLLSALRMLLVAFPAVFFIRRPATAFRNVIAFGLIMFTLQFGLLFCGMHIGATAGLSSLMLQIQVFFTVVLAVIFLQERPTVWQVIGALISFSGIGLVVINLGSEISALSLALIIAAAVAWAAGNIIAKKLSKVDMISLVVWGSMIAWPPLLLLSFLMEQGRWTIETLSDLSWLGIGTVVYIAYPVTLLGFAIWGRLLSTYPAATVAPFTLLVPVVGFFSSFWVLGEQLYEWKMIAAVLIVTGLCINLVGARIARQVRIRWKDENQSA